MSDDARRRAQAEAAKARRAEVLAMRAEREAAIAARRAPPAPTPTDDLDPPPERVGLRLALAIDRLLARRGPALRALLLALLAPAYLVAAGVLVQIVALMGRG